MVHDSKQYGTVGMIRMTCPKCGKLQFIKLGIANDGSGRYIARCQTPGCDFSKTLNDEEELGDLLNSRDRDTQLT